PAWKSYVQQSCAKLLAGTDYDGCYLDMLGTGPLWPGYLPGLPINPATGQVWTRLGWLQATSGIASAVASYTGKPVLGNGIGNGRNSYFYFTANKTDPATLDDPLYHLQIGSPVGGYVVQNGAYVRTFTNGKVVVNPTSSVVSVDLGGSYRRPDGSFALGATLS